VRGEGGEWRERKSASEVVVDVDGAKSEIKVERVSSKITSSASSY